MSPLGVALGLWQAGFVSDTDIVAWADRAISDQDMPSNDLIELSLNGPAACVNISEQDFPTRPVLFTFLQEFALRAILLDLSSYEQTQDFVVWASRRCLGEDIEAPEARLGYQLDHLRCDCNNMPEAVGLLRHDLPALMPRCQSIADSILSLVPGLCLSSPPRTIS